MLDDAARLKNGASPQSVSATESEICRGVAEWVDAINNGNAESIDALYTRDAILLATFDPRPRTTPEERREYFVTFKTRRKLKASIDQCYVTVLGTEGGAASGLYTFNFVDAAGASQTARARFTFVFSRQSEGDCLIAAHHSSQVPVVAVSSN
jgi:hypothetical protein